jgi:hypothetical protein
MATIVFISNQKDGKDTRYVHPDKERRERSALLNNITKNDKELEEQKAFCLASMRLNAFDIYDIFGSHSLMVVKHGYDSEKFINNENKSIDIVIVEKLIQLIANFGCIYFDNVETFELFIAKNSEKFLLNFVNYDKEKLLERYKVESIIHRRV